MKKYISLLSLLALMAGCKHENHRDDTGHHQTHRPADGKYPSMSFTETKFDFGDIKSGDKVTHEFSFKNNGEADLVISKAYGSCGCTVPEYPKEAITPGSEGKITVTFNSAGKHGKQHKTVTLVTNTVNEKEQLEITANINQGE